MNADPAVTSEYIIVLVNSTFCVSSPPFPLFLFLLSSMWMFYEIFPIHSYSLSIQKLQTIKLFVPLT